MNSELLSKRPRIWPGVAMVAAFWAFYSIFYWLDAPISTQFLSRAAAGALLTLLFSIWWLSNRTLPGKERLLGFGFAIAAGIVTALLSRETLGTISLLFMGLPPVISMWTLWLVAARKRSVRTREVGLLVVLSLTWGYFALIRMDGLSGNLEPDVHWRWSPRSEDLFLAERANRTDAVTQPRQAESSPPAIVLQPGDWPAFRGPNRDGEAAGEHIATDWNTNPPKLLWRQRVGPAWSSFAVVGDRLFTQEQRGDAEAVVCFDATSGREVWALQDTARFWDSQSGAGPRATPTFADGRIFALGATGILNCLDAATGERKWFRDIVADSGASVPMWGFSSSPILVKGAVIVFAGGKNGKQLLAYRAGSGEPLWTASAGEISYSSPQLASIDNEEQILFFSDHGLTALDPASGAVRWNYDAAAPGMWRAVQPRQVSPTQILIGSEDLGLILIDVARDERSWLPTQHWASKAMKPAYNDLVVLDQSIYGFDGGIFCCVDLKTSKRRWKEGRYGHGQVLLLADQRLLLVTSETGEAILMAANPEKREELGRFEALRGKTWNHPVIARGRLYARNDEEMACYDLKGSIESAK